MSDDEAIERFLNGDTEAFGVVVQRHDRMVKGFIARAEHDPDKVEEMAQETWAQVLDKIKTYKHGRRFTSWLCGFARNVVMRHRDYMARRCRPLSLDAMEPETGPGLLGPETEHQQAMDKAALERNIARLCPAQREAVRLRVGELLSYEEIAQMTGRNPLTLASDVHRGLEHLRRNWD